MELDADGLVLRPWRPGDEEALVRHADNRRIWLRMRDSFPHPYGVDDAVEWILCVREQADPPLNFAMLDGDEPVGGVGLTLQGDVHRQTAEIGYWVSESHWGRGLATKATRRLTQYAFATFDFERLEAGVFEGNPASCRVLEKSGYRLEARLARNVVKDGRLLDSFLYARLREDPEPAATPA